MDCVHCGTMLGIEDLELVCLACVESGLPVEVQVEVEGN